MYGKIKKSLPEVSKENENDKMWTTKAAVAEYRAFGELHQFTEETVIDGLYLFKIKELRSFHK